MTGLIPYHDFGGRGPLIHFAHPNGYPPACFQRMMDPLLAYFRVIGVCHRPLWMGSQPEDVRNWHTIADDMIQFFEQQGVSGMIGIGHSLGAVTTMYAAVKRPELFRRLVLIEPVFLPPSVLKMMDEYPGAIDELPLVRRASRRRYRWPDREAAFERFRAKAVFGTWSDTALWDYVNNATHKDKNGEVVLTYSREWEARIYALPPTDVWETIPAMTHPTLALRGAETDTLSSESWQRWQILQPQAKFVELADVGHMMPMEQPEIVAAEILDFLQGEAGE